jgi:peptidyl-prolyl cis-trans isomerase A (cyclophilin A)
MRSTTIAAVALTTAAFGCDHKPKDQPGNVAPEPVGRDEVRAPAASDLADYLKEIPGDGKLMATIETPLGTLHCELFGDKAPMTVANFVGLATGRKSWRDPSGNIQKNKPFFDGLVFHRVIPTFMIQGGDPKGVGVGGPGYSFADEFVDGLEMSPGTLAMANSGKATNGSQFFVMEGSSPGLVGKHTIFGRCLEVEVVTKITNTPRNADDKPDTPVTMKITIKKGQ